MQIFNITDTNFLIALKVNLHHHSLMEDTINLYIILGTAQSGRREILYDLIEGSSDLEEVSKFVLICSNEPETPASEKLRNLPKTQVLEWDFSENRLNLPKLEALPGDSVFLILSSKADLIDQIEAVKYWLDGQSEFTLARILSVISCKVAYENEVLLPWFKAAVYFSDYILLTHREDVPDKWISDFVKSFAKENYPCIFERVKKNKVNNPDQVLEAEARRISHIFDNLEAVDTMEFDEDNLPEEPFELIKKIDPYLERDQEGNRIIKLPSISDY